MILRTAVAALLAFAMLEAADFKDVNKTVALHPNGSVTLENHKGSIHVTTWDRAEVEIQARIQAEDGTSMDRRRFEGTDVRIDSSTGAVHIRTIYPEFNSCCSPDDGNNPEVRYTIRMPRTGRLTIRDHRSETQIADVGGALDIDTHRGTVRVERLSGPLQLTTHRGDVTVGFASFNGNSSIGTYRGTIELTLPKSSRFNLQTDLGKHASVNSDFPVVVRSANRQSESMQGNVNGGGPTLDIKTVRGSIRLHSM
jgi:DUF4097 and DUF4098 domain-containing protein YvlB